MLFKIDDIVTQNEICCKLYPTMPKFKRKVIKIDDLGGKIVVTVDAMIHFPSPITGGKLVDTIHISPYYLKLDISQLRKNKLEKIKEL